MTLLLDQGIPADAALLFSESGFDCVHVSALGLQQAADKEILAVAQSESRVVITLDADFHALVAVRAMKSPSVVRLRREGCKADATFRILLPVPERYRTEIEDGALISVKEHRVTCHRLPVGRDV